MLRASQSVETLELRVDEVACKANALASEAREELEAGQRGLLTLSEVDVLGRFWLVLFMFLLVSVHVLSPLTWFLSPFFFLWF